MAYRSKKAKTAYDVEYQKKHRQRMRKRIDDLKRVPCGICGIQYNPWQMHFDHIDHAKKSFNIAEAYRRYDRWATIQAEIDKRRVLCANCHADVTHRDQGLYGKLKIISPDSQLTFL